MITSDDSAVPKLVDTDLGSDRAAVISMVAMFENILGEAIRGRLVPLSKKQDEILFGDRGPFATFSSKIDVGYALGLYGKETKTTLHIIRGIRNTFAHEEDAKDFSHKEVVRKGQNLPLMPDGTNDLRRRFIGAQLRIIFGLNKYLHAPQRPQAPSADLP